jgi:hypothetical protein
MNPVLWIVGGPVALALGHRGIDRAYTAGGTGLLQWLALAGIVLRRLMLWGGIGLLSLVLWRR